MATRRGSTYSPEPVAQADNAANAQLEYNKRMKQADDRARILAALREDAKGLPPNALPVGGIHDRMSDADIANLQHRINQIKERSPITPRSEGGNASTLLMPKSAITPIKPLENTTIAPAPADVAKPQIMMNGVPMDNFVFGGKPIAQPPVKSIPVAATPNPAAIPPAPVKVGDTTISNPAATPAQTTPPAPDTPKTNPALESVVQAPTMAQQMSDFNNRDRSGEMARNGIIGSGEGLQEIKPPVQSRVLPSQTKILDPNGPGTIIDQEGRRRLYVGGKEVGSASPGVITDDTGNKFNPATGISTPPVAPIAKAPATPQQAGQYETVPQTPNVSAAVPKPPVPPAPAPTSLPFKAGQVIGDAINPRTYTQPVADAAAATAGVVKAAGDKALAAGTDFMGGLRSADPNAKPATPAQIAQQTQGMAAAGAIPAKPAPAPTAGDPNALAAMQASGAIPKNPNQETDEEMKARLAAAGRTPGTGF